MPSTPPSPRSRHTGADDTAAPIALRLTVRSNGLSSDVLLSSSGATRLRDVLGTVVPALAERGPAARTLAAASERLGTWLDLDRPIGAAGLTDGDLVHVGPFADLANVVEAASPSGEIEVWVHGGPRAGEHLVLSTGTHIVGRDRRAADVVVADDPSLSKRHLELRVAERGVVVADLASANATFVDGVVVSPGEPVSVEAGALIEAGRSAFSWRPAHEGPHRLAGEREALLVRRPPRLRARWEPPGIKLAAPPDDPRRTRIPFLASLVPLALGLVLFLLTGQVAMLLISLLAPIVAVASRVEDRVGGARDFRGRSRAFRNELSEVAERLSAAISEETLARRAEAPDAADLLRRITDPSGELWVRRSGDDDFLDLRIGSADQPSRTTVAFTPGGNAALRTTADAEMEALRVVRSAPVIVPLGRIRSLGIVGPVDAVDRLGRWLAIQAAIFHAPGDFAIRAAVGPGRLQAWDWLKWLPHAREGSLPSPLVVGQEAAHELIDRSIGLGQPNQTGQPGSSGGPPRSLWLVDGSLELDPRRTARVLEAASAGEIAVIWLAAEQRDLPNQIASIVRLDQRLARLTLVEVESGRTVEATADGLPQTVAEAAARDLAPLMDPMTAEKDASIPSRVSLVEALRGELTDDWLDARWATPRAATVLGVTADAVFSVDLPVDGPHALIGGTTGSGKSELLQTFVAGLALANPPSRVSFLLIDYKGGAAFRDGVDLPHVTGLVTDLEGNLARRALVSLDAEIRRREKLLARLGSRSLDAAVEQHPADAPARLVIVIDEFAALVRDVPEFVDGVVDIAQRGRTLGVHLVLATQRPAGSVTREVWANTNLRIALRVADPADSMDVIGTPDAAAITSDQPGRALARIGQSAPIAFQSAYVGGPAPRRAAPKLEAMPLAFAGTVPTGQRRVPRESESGPAAVAGGATELAAIVDATTRAAERWAISRPPAPWLPQLPSRLSLEAVNPPEPLEGVAPFGLVDDPARQTQEPAVFDLARDGAMLVYGGGGSGKTTLLRSLAAALAMGSTAREIQLHALDFGAGGLQSLLALPHVGSVVSGGDEERVLRLMAMLGQELADRQQRFAELGTPDLEAFRSGAPGGTSLPRIVLLLDGYGTFAANFERVQFGQALDLIARLATDGRAVGLHLIATADRRGSVPSRLAGVIGRRVILQPSDDAEYGQHGIDRRAYAGLPATPGRGLTEAALEVQVAIVGDDPTAGGQAAAIRAVGERARLRAPGVSAPAVGVLPADIPAAELGAPGRPGSAVIARADRNLLPISIDLGEGHFVVAGPLRSGRSTTLATIAQSIRTGAPAIALHLLAPRRTPLTTLDLWTSVSEGLEACDARIASIALEPQVPGDITSVVVIDDGDELLESASAQTLATIARRGRDAGLRIVAAVELRTALRAYGGWLAELRKDRHGLLLQPGQEMAGELLGAVLPRAAQGARPFPPGRGYLIVRGDVELVQVAR